MNRSSPSFGNPFRRIACWLRRVACYEHWMVGIVDQPVARAPGWTEPPLIRWISPFEKTRYLADPMPWPGSADTLLVEEYDTVAMKGRLIALRLDANGIVGELPVDVPLKGHLSFPFLFESEGETFLMPESSEDRQLAIFRWDAGKWVPHAVVFDDRAVADAVLFKKDGLFWIAFTDISLDPHDNLHLVYASALTGPWTEHPQNPVQRGRDRCRGGGAFFEANGKLYRPAQDCAAVYGGALRLMEVVACSPSEYREVEITRLSPNSCVYPDGFHTLSAWGDKCLVDGMRRVFSSRLVWHKLLRRLGRR